MATALIGAAVAVATLVAAVRGATGARTVVCNRVVPKARKPVAWHRVNAGGSGRV